MNGVKISTNDWTQVEDLSSMIIQSIYDHYIASLSALIFSDLYCYRFCNMWESARLQYQFPAACQHSGDACIMQWISCEHTVSCRAKKLINKSHATRLQHEGNTIVEKSFWMYD